MQKSKVADDHPVAFYFGQVHGLKAFAHALIRTYPERIKLLAEFRGAAEQGLRQLRAVPVPRGTVHAYRLLCDELIVALAQEVQKSHRRRPIIL